MTTFAHYLVNEGIPSEYQLKGVLDKKSITQHLIKLAKEKPELYPVIVSNVKKVGDMFATYEGHSVGLDDIEPMMERKNKLVASTQGKLEKAKTPEDKVKILLEAQALATDMAKSHPGTMATQVISGGRGSAGQLLKSVMSPMTAKGPGDVPLPHLITKSFTEGLTPGEHWMTLGEARREQSTVQLSTALPGESSKIITSVLNNVLITRPDCGTKNGLAYSVEDHHATDRYEAGTNKLITDEYLRALKKKKIDTIMVRSPLTCLENPGVCQKCYGLTVQGQHLNIGTNIGLRSAQSLSEPLTQMTLKSKHGVFTAREAKPELRGMPGLRQLLDIPEIFKDEAVLALSDGKITKIESSPQGGSFIYIGNDQHFVNPKRKILVKPGQSVVKGQELTDGIPNPKHVVDLRGLGAGRQYMLDTVHKIYKDSGLDLDKRHVELLTKQDLNYAKITKGGASGTYVAGSVVPYNKLKEYMSSGAKEEPVSQNILGKKLGGEYLHFTVGTLITQGVLNALKSSKIKTVKIMTKKIEFQPIVKPIDQIPLMSKDWLSMLAHRRLKDTLTKAPAEGWESEIHGAAPYPALIFGAEDFGKNLDKGTY